MRLMYHGRGCASSRIRRHEHGDVASVRPPYNSPKIRQRITMRVYHVGFEFTQFIQYRIGAISIAFRHRRMIVTLQDIVLPFDYAGEITIKLRSSPRFCEHYKQFNPTVGCDTTIHGAEMLYRMGYDNCQAGAMD